MAVVRPEVARLSEKERALLEEVLNNQEFCARPALHTKSEDYDQTPWAALVYFIGEATRGKLTTATKVPFVRLIKQLHTQMTGLMTPMKGHKKVLPMPAAVRPAVRDLRPISQLSLATGITEAQVRTWAKKTNQPIVVERGTRGQQYSLEKLQAYLDEHKKKA